MKEVRSAHVILSAAKDLARFFSARGGSAFGGGLNLRPQNDSIFLSCDRQKNLESGASADLAVDKNAAIVLSDNLMD